MPANLFTFNWNPETFTWHAPWERKIAVGAGKIVSSAFAISQQDKFKKATAIICMITSTLGGLLSAACGARDESRLTDAMLLTVPVNGERKIVCARELEPKIISVTEEVTTTRVSTASDNATLPVTTRADVKTIEHFPATDEDPCPKPKETHREGAVISDTSEQDFSSHHDRKDTVKTTRQIVLPQREVYLVNELTPENAKDAIVAALTNGNRAWTDSEFIMFAKAVRLNEILDIPKEEWTTIVRKSDLEKLSEIIKLRLNLDLSFFQIHKTGNNEADKYNHSESTYLSNTGGINKAEAQSDQKQTASPTVSPTISAQSDQKQTASPTVSPTISAQGGAGGDADVQTSQELKGGNNYADGGNVGDIDVDGSKASSYVGPVISTSDANAQNFNQDKTNIGVTNVNKPVNQTYVDDSETYVDDRDLTIINGGQHGGGGPKDPCNGPDCYGDTSALENDMHIAKMIRLTRPAAPVKIGSVVLTLEAA